ncbi:hypothetical protein BpHYR1_020154 [Brachionus plicatilis]|uniref:Uncharacterized protein n=1 Tax=Brachionus plicatilis TaxID=10195 RepID=A0A3M7PXJ9_BRAPC|nr:hypothetical protein BpHYR1_020154 [Brachionus plicatilis]
MSAQKWIEVGWHKFCIVRSVLSPVGHVTDQFERVLFRTSPQQITPSYITSYNQTPLLKSLSIEFNLNLPLVKYINRVINIWLDMLNCGEFFFPIYQRKTVCINCFYSNIFVSTKN